MPTTTTLINERPPLRILERLLAAKAAFCTRVSDVGGQFEIAMFRRQVERHRVALVACSTEAGQIVAQEAAIEDTVLEITSPASEAGPAITPAEQRRLNLELAALRTTATTHAANLKELSS